MLPGRCSDAHLPAGLGGALGLQTDHLLISGYPKDVRILTVGRHWAPIPDSDHSERNACTGKFNGAGTARKQWRTESPPARCSIPNCRGPSTLSSAQLLFLRFQVTSDNNDKKWKKKNNKLIIIIILRESGSGNEKQLLLSS